nr:MAG TPA: hypothetical protein [Caudoviricetes sp.]
MIGPFVESDGSHYMLCKICVCSQKPITPVFLEL